jgi:hypothetical protein
MASCDATNTPAIDTDFASYTQVLYNEAEYPLSIQFRGCRGQSVKPTLLGITIASIVPAHHVAISSKEKV